MLSNVLQLESKRLRVSIALDEKNVAHVVLDPVVENSEISLEQTKNNRDPISNR